MLVVYLTNKLGSFSLVWSRFAPRQQVPFVIASSGTSIVSTVSYVAPQIIRQDVQFTFPLYSNHILTMFLPQHRCLLVFIMMVLLTINVFALDVSFIPNSENEPLPLSAKYRDSLRKLCVLIKNEGAVLPPELLKKKAVLEKVCSKLDKDDQNIDGSKPGGKFSRTKQTILYGLIGLGSGYYLWTNRAWLKSKLRNTPNTSQRNILGRGDASATSSIVADSETLVADSVGVDAGHVINSSPVVHSPVTVEAKTVGADKIAEARAARLKRFSEMNSVNVNVQ